MSPRVVSLVPSLSETLVAWGVEPLAVTRFCELPGRRTVGGTKNPDVEAIAGLAPDLVLVDREENRREDAEAMEAAGLRLWVSAVRSVSDVAPMLADLRGALGLGGATVEGEGDDAAGVEAPARERKLRVWVPIWRRPWMAVNDDTYGGSVLAVCGVTNVLGDRPDRYPEVDLAEVAALAPDVTLAPSEPYPWAERHRHLFEEVAPMVLVDGKDLFWWGFRTAGALARLRSRLDGIEPAG